MVRVQRIGLPIVWSDPKTRAVSHAEKAPCAHFARRSMRGRIRRAANNNGAHGFSECPGWICRSGSSLVDGR